MASDFLLRRCHRRGSVCPVVLWLVSLFSSSALSQEHPYAVVFDSFYLYPAVRSAAIRLEREFALKPEDREMPVPAEESLVPEQFKDLWRNHSSAGYPFVLGRAHYYFPDTGEFKSVRVAKLPGRTDFQKYMIQELARRPGVSTSGTEDRMLVMTPPQDPVKPGDPRVEWQDASYAYDDGVLVFSGGRVALDVNLQNLRPLIKEGEGRDWHMIVQPNQAPPAARKAFFERYALGWAVLMQRRDGEETPPYRTRYNFYAMYSAALQGLVNDTESLTSSVTFPRDSSGYSREFHVTFRDETPSANMIRNLLPIDELYVSEASNALVSMHINARLPLIARDYLQSVAGSISDGLADGRSLASLILRRLALAEQSSAVLQVVSNKNGLQTLSARGCFPWSDDETLENLTRGSHGVHDDRGAVRFPLMVPDILKLDREYEVIASVAGGGSRCEFSISPQEDVSEPADETLVPMKRNLLLSAKVDLSAFARDSESSSAARSLLLQLERFYHDRLTTIGAEISGKRKSMGNAEFQSVTPLLSGEGDWTASFDVAAVGDRGLRIQLHVGRELYGVVSARHRLSQLALQ